MSDISSAVERAKAVAARLTAAAKASGQFNNPSIPSTSYSKRKADEDDIPSSGYSRRDNLYGDSKRLRDDGGDGGRTKHGLGTDDATNSFLAKLGLTNGLVSTKISKEITIPADMVGLIIGRGGETLKRIQAESGAAKIQFAQDHEPGDPVRRTTLIGSESEIERAEALIMDLVNGDRRGMGGSAYGPKGTLFPMEVPQDRVGLVIGRGGETIKMLQAKTGARITVVQDGANVKPGFKVVNIQGSDEQIAEAKQMIDDIVLGRVMVGSGAPMPGYGGGPQPGQIMQEVRVPNDKVGLVIGKGGEHVKNVQNNYGVRLQIEQHPEPSGERLIRVYGPSQEAINGAIEIIYDKAGMRGMLPPAPDMSDPYAAYGEAYAMMAQQGYDYSQYYEQAQAYAAAAGYDPATYAAYMAAAAGGAVPSVDASGTAPAAGADTAEAADPSAATASSAAEGADDAANAAAWAAYYQYYAQYGGATGEQQAGADGAPAPEAPAGDAPPGS